LPVGTKLVLGRRHELVSSAIEVPVV
jgi:hypothetical protein